MDAAAKRHPLLFKLSYDSSSAVPLTSLIVAVTVMRRGRPPQHDLVLATKAGAHTHGHNRTGRGGGEHAPAGALRALSGNLGLKLGHAAAQRVHLFFEQEHT